MKTVKSALLIRVGEIPVASGERVNGLAMQSVITSVAVTMEQVRVSAQDSLCIERANTLIKVAIIVTSMPVLTTRVKTAASVNGRH